MLLELFEVYALLLRVRREIDIVGCFREKCPPVIVHTAGFDGQAQS